ncbi:MAG: divergent polysaccharide deacetylase family protein [Alphaproteobacteria bacterium]|nr:divergent polysaccharide deacetylase family protein [Alphaproteobacteria bacterium]
MTKKRSAAKARAAKRLRKKRQQKCIVKPQPYFTWWRVLLIAAMAFCIGAAVALYNDYRQSRVETQLSRVMDAARPGPPEETAMPIKTQAQTDQEYLEKLIAEVKDDYPAQYEEHDLHQPALPPPPPPPRPALPPAPAYAPRPVTATNKIVIIIDDMGLNGKRADEIMALHPNITLSYLTYAPNLVRQLEKAVSQGREVMLHIPMQAWRVPVTDGMLHDRMSGRQIDHMMDQYLSKCIKGCVGINNHMGSRLTANPYYMQRVIRKLSGRNLVFVDSRTTNSSVAYDIAVQNNVPALKRDVFIDHDEGVENAMRQLDRLLEISRRRGLAVGIGHPKPSTITAIRRWTANLPDGFELITVSQAANY